MNTDLLDPVARRIAIDDEDSMSRFVDGVAAAFTRTALSMAFITEKDATPPPYPSELIDVNRLREHVGPHIRDSANHGAEIVEAGHFSALAVWETPSYTGTSFSARAMVLGPIVADYRTQVRQCKEKHLGLVVSEDGQAKLKPHYYLDFFARNPTVESTPGALTAVMQPWLDRAKAEGLPAWLEATYEKAVKVYEHFGFRVVEKITVGVGHRNEHGWPQTGNAAVGVSGYAMIFDAHIRS